MAELNGTQIIAPIVMPSDNDIFPTHYAKYGCGNVHSVNDINERNNISVNRREIGMLCYVQTEDKFYQLIGGIDNANWKDPFNPKYLSSNGGTVNGDIKATGNVHVGDILLKNNSGALEIKNSADTGFVDLSINNLNVRGTTTTIYSETVNIADNTLLLNSNITSQVPTENGGIEISRGSLTNSDLLWNETNDRWVAGLKGSESILLLDSDSSVNTTSNSIVKRDSSGNINANTFNGNINSNSIKSYNINITGEYDLNGQNLDNRYMRSDISTFTNGTISIGGATYYGPTTSIHNGSGITINSVGVDGEAGIQFGTGTGTNFYIVRNTVNSSDGLRFYNGLYGSGNMLMSLNSMGEFSTINNVLDDSAGNLSISGNATINKILTINKQGNASTIAFPPQQNDAGYIKHIENNDVAEMRFSVSDNNDGTDYFTWGSSANTWSEIARLTTNGNMTLHGGLTTNGLIVNGDISSTGKLSNNSLITNGLTVNGNITSTGTSTVAGLTVSGDISSTGKLSNNSITTNGLTVNGDISSTSKLSNNSIVTNSLIVNGDTKIVGNIIKNNNVVDLGETSWAINNGETNVLGSIYNNDSTGNSRLMIYSNNGYTNLYIDGTIYVQEGKNRVLNISDSVVWKQNANSPGAQRLYRDDTNDAYYLHHQWINGEGWKIKADNDVSDTQAGIHNVIVDRAYSADNAIISNNSLKFNGFDTSYFQKNMSISEKLATDAPSTWPVGIYYSPAYNTGWPATYGTVLTIKGTTGASITQIFQSWPDSDGGNSDIWIRAKRDTGTDIWGSWSKLYNNNNLQNISQLNDDTKKCGVGNFSGNSKTTTIAHGLNAIPANVQITLAGASNGNCGEYWASCDFQNIYITNTGNYTGMFYWSVCK